MSVDKLVDSTQLDTDLTSVANAIRTKANINGTLSFPSGMVSAINNISSRPENISTDAEMSALLVSANERKVYKFIGDSSTYGKNSYYLVDGQAFGSGQYGFITLGETTSFLDYLCFTAEEANSTVSLNATNSAPSVTLEVSSDGRNWGSYTIGTIITLPTIGDRVYWRGNNNTFGTDTSKYNYFTMSGKISASGNIMSLLDKTCVSVSINNSYCFYFMFYGCTSLTTAPSLPATSVAYDAYESMFYGCTSLTTLPSLPATTLSGACYRYMFQGCTSLKVSKKQTGDYQYEYRIPQNGTGTTTSYSLTDMFTNTGGTFTGTPSINTTYYTTHQPV